MTRFSRLLSGLILGSLCACASRAPDDINPMQRLHVARAAEEGGNPGLARAMYAATAEVSTDRGQQLQAADGLARVGDPAGAIVVLSGILARSPSDDDARARLGSMELENNQPSEAARDLAMVLANRPDDDTARVNLGVALDTLGRHNEAQPLYREALRRAPSDITIANDLALSLMLSGQRDAARLVLAPFLNRADMPARMRATVELVDGPEASVPAAGGPTPLYPGAR